MFCLSEQITCIFFYIAIKFYILANHCFLLIFGKNINEFEPIGDFESLVIV